MRSILRFAFVVVPTAVLASAVVVGVSRNGHGAARTSDGDLQQDLKLASATTLELAPAGRPVATISAVESPPSATPERSVRPKRSISGPRAVRSRTPVVKAAPEPEVADADDASETSTTTDLAAAPEAIAEAPAPGGVALPRPSAIPVIIPTGGTGSGGVYGGDEGGVYGGGSVIRGGVLDGDHCQIHGRGPVYGGPIYRRPGARGIRLGDVLRGGQISRERPSSLGDRVRSSQGRSSSSAGRTSAGSSRGSIGGRMGAVRR